MRVPRLFHFFCVFSVATFGKWVFTQNMNEINALRIEIGNCNLAIKAFQLGEKQLAPDGLNDAPSVEWLKMQKNVCVRRINKLKALAA